MADSYFRQYRNCELSAIYYLETQVTANWTGITVVKGFPLNDKAELPIISIRVTDSSPTAREIGSRSMFNYYLIIIDIFAKHAGQREDLAQFIEDTVINDFVYYEHSHPSGDPTSLSRVANGKVVFQEFVSSGPVNFGEDASLYDKNRHNVSYNVRLSKNS